MADTSDERTCAISADFTADELAALHARAAQAGLTLEAYCRTLLGLEP